MARNGGHSPQDEAYAGAARTYGAMIERMARGYEADPELRRDLIGIGVMVGLFVGVWLLNQWGARKLQKHIDDIDALLGEQG